MMQSFVGFLIALAFAAPAAFAFQNFVDSSRYTHALLTLGGMVTLLLLMLIAPR